MSHESKHAEGEVVELPCGTCGRELRFVLGALPDSFPFCSMRCKTLDLGSWLIAGEDASDEASSDADSHPEESSDKTGG